MYIIISYLISNYQLQNLWIQNCIVHNLYGVIEGRNISPFLIIFNLSKPPAHHLCRVNFFGTRVINDWNNLTSDIVENSSLNSFKSAVDNYFYDFKFMFHS